MSGPQQCGIRAVSAIYTTAHGNAGSLTHWARPGIGPATSWLPGRFVNHCATTGTPGFLLFLFLLIVIARTSKVMLSSSGKSRHPCLVPYLSRKSFSFSPLRICSLWDCHIRPSLCWGRFPLCPFLKGFYWKWVLDFVKGFFCIYQEDHMVFIPQFVNVVITLISDIE